MTEMSTIGLDLAKSVFQVHGIGANGAVAVKRQLRRSEVLTWFGKQKACLVGLEACGGAHYWAREIRALGHDVRLIPPAYVKPYVKRGKTDAPSSAPRCLAPRAADFIEASILQGRNQRPDIWKHRFPRDKRRIESLDPQEPFHIRYQPRNADAWIDRVQPSRPFLPEDKRRLMVNHWALAGEIPHAFQALKPWSPGLVPARYFPMESGSFFASSSVRPIEPHR